MFGLWSLHGTHLYGKRYAFKQSRCTADEVFRMFEMNEMQNGWQAYVMMS